MKFNSLSLNAFIYAKNHTYLDRLEMQFSSIALTQHAQGSGFNPQYNMYIRIHTHTHTHTHTHIHTHSHTNIPRLQS